MMRAIREIYREWSPRQLWSSTMIFLVAILILKLLVFTVTWCSATSVSYLSNPLVYINIILLSFVLSFPIGLFHRKWVQVGVLVGVDCWLITTLVYNGNVLVPFQPFEYLLLGALPESMVVAPHFAEWSYLFFAVASVAAIGIALRTKGRTPVPLWGKLQYVGYLVGWSVLSFLAK